MPASMVKFADDMDKNEDNASKVHAINLDSDFVSHAEASPLRKDSFKGKALQNISSGEKHSARRSKSKQTNAELAKPNGIYSVKQLTLDIKTKEEESVEETNEIEDFFPDDISDRVQLFDRIPHPPPRSALKTRPCRTQSAKASLPSNKDSKPTEDLSKALVMKKRPASAHVISAKSNENDKPLEPHIWKYDCKESPRKSSSTSALNESVPEPYIFGYKSGRLLSGKRPTESPPREKPDIKVETTKKESNVPKCLKPFLPWQVHGDIPLHWTGVDPSTCLVLCPSLFYQVHDLPTVPPKQLPEEELDYIEKIYPSVPTKKYKHPWTKLALPEPKCSHSVPSARLPMSAQVRIYSMDGQLLHETYQGNRTAEVVRKEIQELEDLMKGKGSHEGSLFVQYQAEITDMQNVLDKMLGRVEEIERREEERRRRAETPDYFGLKKFYKEHDSVMSRIRQQHELCKVELAALEGQLDINDPHFSLKIQNKGK